MKWFFPSKQQTNSKSNVFALFSKDNHETNTKAVTVFDSMKEKLSLLLNTTNNGLDGMESNTRCFKIAENCIDLLVEYGVYLNELENNRQKKYQYKPTLVGEAIDLLGSFSNQTLIHTRQATHKLLLNKTIADRHSEHMLTLHDIEFNKSTNLLSDVYDHFKKTSQESIRNNKQLTRTFQRQSSRKQSMHTTPSNSITMLRNNNHSSNGISIINGAKNSFKSRIITRNFLESQTIIRKLYQLESWDSVNIFEVDELSQGNTLLIYLPIMMERFGFLGTKSIATSNNNNIQPSQSIKVDRKTLYAWIDRVSFEGYHDLRYHSSIHAADVLQTVFYYVTRRNADAFSILTEEDIFALFIGACIHDYQHPGISHPYLIQSDHTSRYIYNDIDVLEHFHLSSCFQMMKKNNLDIFAQLSRGQTKRIKKYIIDSVLATNFGHQNELMFDMQNDLGKHYIYGQTEQQIIRTRSILRPLLMHASDISHCFKDLKIHKEWSERYFEEFFIEKEMLKTQGILSTGIHRKDFSKEQVLFFELWCLPFYKIFYDLVDFEEKQKIWKIGQQNYEYWKNGEKKLI